MTKLSIETIKHILDDIQADIKDVKSESREYFKVSNGRIKKLELWQARIMGAIMIIGIVLIPVISQWVAKIAVAYFQ